MNASLNWQPQIRLISFDLDDTLWDTRVVIVRAEQKLHAWLSEHAPGTVDNLTPMNLREWRDQLATKHPAHAHDFTWLRKQVIAEAAKLAGHAPAEIVEPAFAEFIHWRNQVVFFDDALETLATLKQHYPLCAITNGNADIAAIGLDQYFDFCITAIDIGAAKPDPKLFAAACEQANVQPNQVLHVGDHPIADVQGAQQFGMRTAWFNPESLVWEGDIAADVETQTLAELRNALL